MMFSETSGSLMLYVLIVFVTSTMASGFIRVQTGLKIALFNSVVVFALLWFLDQRLDAAAGAQLVRLLAFQTYLSIFCFMLYGKDAMTFLTNWCMFFHVQYFAVGSAAESLDWFVGVAHACGFFAAYSVFFGFLVAAAVGGTVPDDVMLRARKEPATEIGICSFIGWMHGSPTLYYVLDAMLDRERLQRLYRGRRLSTMALGLAIFFNVGQVWECLHPNTIEVYSAPAQVWRRRGQAFAKFLRLGTPEQLKNRTAGGVFRFGEDIAFSWLVKYGGVAGALCAAFVLDRLVLSACDADGTCP